MVLDGKQYSQPIGAFEKVLKVINYFFFQSDDNASFLRAARGGNLEKVLEYLKANTDINTCNAVMRRLRERLRDRDFKWSEKS